MSETSSNSGHQSRRQGIYWLLTIGENDWSVPDTLPSNIRWIRGQLEQGEETGYRHWQLVVGFINKCSLTSIKRIFGERVHGELTQSAAANDYVWKDDTAIAGTRFELGAPPFHRNSKTDWAEVRRRAESGDMANIPDDIYIRYNSAIHRIASINVKPLAMEREAYCYWGKTGTGKTSRAWDEAGEEAFSKMPNTKFWDGYRNEENVIIDEFRGSIDIGDILRWTDKRKVIVEVKGGIRPLNAKKFWFTSNQDPRDWYKFDPRVTTDDIDALLRRFQGKIIHFENPFRPLTEQIQELTLEDEEEIPLVRQSHVVRRIPLNSETLANMSDEEFHHQLNLF